MRWLKDRWREIALVFAGIVTLAGAVNAWSDVEPLVPALRGYVVAQLAPTNLAVDRLIKAQLEGQLYAARRDPAAATSPTVKRRIRELEEQIAETDRRISSAPKR